ncbi:MAG: S-adenosylmethionine:tRNA ribosyltransferase-isomerase [Chitinophagaceae bacterium]
MQQNILIEDYDYALPNERIAYFPLAERDASKLLVYKSGKIEDDTFYHLPHHLPLGATLIANNTRVIEARLHFIKESGGVIEIFCLEPYSPAAIVEAMESSGPVQWRCLIGGASKWKPGLVLQKEVLVEAEVVKLEARYITKEEDSFIIEFNWSGGHPFAEVLHVAGAMPLPPYIKRKAEGTDAARYQTVFAEHNGSVAAPTAALHFTERVFKGLEEKGITRRFITLHVGAGTFKPVKTATIAEHSMHAESFVVTADTLQKLLKAETLVAVGTTSLRTLESLNWLGVKLLQNPALTDFTLEQWEAYDLAQQTFTYKESIQALVNYLQQKGETELWCRTALLIMPGYRFQAVKALITNFHQPRSTLLLLVAAFIGNDWKKVYDHAMKNGYRFLSYGDSSLLYPLSP